MRVVLVAVMVLAAGGCAVDDGTDGDCGARVRYEGVLYRSHSLLPEKASLGAPAGEGDVVGCGGIDADPVARVEVRPVEGVDPDVAVGVRGEWRGVYIREDLADEPSSWPQPLRD